MRIEIDMLNYLLVIHLVSILLVFSMEKVIDFVKAFDMIHETYHLSIQRYYIHQMPQNFFLQHKSDHYSLTF